MKIIVCLAAAFLLVGCGQSPPAQTKDKPVSVGMVYDDAWPALSGAGGRHLDIDSIKDTDTHIREVSRFPNGTIVLIEISLESKKITGLKVCVDPDQPTHELQWRSVRAFHPGID